MIWRLLSRTASPGGDSGTLSVLFFHRVLPGHDPLLPGEPTTASFGEMLHWLRTQFTLLPLGDALRRLGERTLPPAAAAITFDDGYRDNLELAAPILQRHGIPATFFITTDFMDGELMWNDRVIEGLRHASVDRLSVPRLEIHDCPLGSASQRRAALVNLLGRLKYLHHADRNTAVDEVVQACRPTRRPELMMDARQVRKLASLGFEIGAHTCSHPILTQMPDEQAEGEITRSRTRLQAELDAEVPLFAYPNGREGVDFDHRHHDMVRRAGFAAAFTTEAGVSECGTDRWRLPRFTPWDRTAVRFRMQLLRNQLRRPARESRIHPS